MDTKQLQEIKARADAAWYDIGSFIGHARTDIPALVAEVERLAAENSTLKKALEKLADIVQDEIGLGDIPWAAWAIQQAQEQGGCQSCLK